MNGALYIREEEVQQLASIPEVIENLQTVFEQQARGEAFANPRQRLRMPGATLHMMAGAIPGYFGYKAYTSAAGRTRFLFHLFKANTIELLAIMEADALGQIRTGAASGLATRVLSKLESSEAVIFGAGWQAESQLKAIDAVRSLNHVWIVNRDTGRRDAFMQKMQPLVRARLQSANSPEEAVRQSHIITTITTSRDPVVRGDWLQAGQHINAAGGNMLVRRELDDTSVLRADRIVVDSLEQARLEAGEFLSVVETGRKRWQDLIELREYFGPRPVNRRADEITLFKSMGIALEDVAIGKLVYERAIENGMGRRFAI